MTKIFRIQGMCCAACAKSIERVTSRLEGVESSNVNLATEKLVISFEPKLIEENKIISAIEKAGFKVFEEGEDP